MKKLLIHITSLVLALVILISTSGFMVYVHHCHHHQETFSSVFFNFNEVDELPCHAEITSCCSNSEEEPQQSRCDSECCQDTVFLYKISPDTEPAQKSSVKLQPVALDLAKSERVELLSETASTGSEILTAPPERQIQSGKSLVIQYHQLKTGNIFSLS